MKLDQTSEWPSLQYQLHVQEANDPPQKTSHVLDFTELEELTDATPSQAKRAKLQAAEKVIEELRRQLEDGASTSYCFAIKVFKWSPSKAGTVRDQACGAGGRGEARRSPVPPADNSAAGGASLAIFNISFAFIQTGAVRGQAQTWRPRKNSSKSCAASWRRCCWRLPPFLLFFIKSSSVRFLSQALFEAKCTDLEASEKLVEDLRCQLEAALLEARAKRENAVAAKRKFEASRRGVEAEMSAVREKVCMLRWPRRAWWRPESWAARAALAQNSIFGQLWSTAFRKV